MTICPQFLVAFAAVAASETAWWEGRWVDQGALCEEAKADQQPIRLSWNRLLLGEAECSHIREAADGSKLVLSASCRDHSDPTIRARRFMLEPSDGGRAMILSDGQAVWHLRKCPAG